jgi:hypothetical protein
MEDVSVIGESLISENTLDEEYLFSLNIYGIKELNLGDIWRN